MTKVIIHRDKYLKKATLGKCYVKYSNGRVVYVGNSLERAWLNNKRRVSCIPIGEYPLVLEFSPRFGKKLWEVKDVPNRSECKFHSANYWYQLNGCIALGVKRKDIDFDGVPDVTSSRNTLKKFHKLLQGETRVKLIIKDI